MRRTLPTISVLVGALLIGASLLGCARRASDESNEPALVSSTEAGPVSLRVEVDHDTMRSVDRVRVDLIASIAAGARLEGFGFDAELDGWTIIDDRAETVLTDPGRVHRRHLVLEPFLEGTYEVPAVRATWREGDRAGVALSQALQIEVTSVLEPEDPLSLGEFRPVPEAPPAARGRVTPVWAMAALGLMGGLDLLIALVMLRRRGRSDATGAILERLERIAAGAEDVEQAGAEAAAALRCLAGKPDEVTRRLIDQLDDARFERDGRDRMRDLIAGAREHARRR
ncbi:MAG: hypothetical protein ACIARR_10975, partial [Phycisphaerales bacterium JB059]